MTAYKILLALLVITLLVLQMRLWIGEGSYAHVDGLEKKVVVEEVANSVKNERNEVLRAEIRDLKSGHESIEEKARVELGLIKEGETFYLLVEQDEP